MKPFELNDAMQIHDWTFLIGDYSFGVIEWPYRDGPECGFFFGRHLFDVPLSGAQTLAVFLALSVIIVTAAVILRVRHQRPNHALQRTRPSRPGCNRGVPRAGSLSLGR